MLVWRLEDSDGKGPWTGSHYYGWPRDSNRDSRQPYDPALTQFIWEGRNAGNNDLWLFGFENQRHLHSWFIPAELRVLHQRGLKIVEYSVLESDTIKSRSQLVFCRNRAVKTGSFQIWRPKMILTRAQRVALYEVFTRCPLDENHRRPTRGEHPISYRKFRAAVRPVIGDACILFHWCGMWLGIEPDGYTHS